MPARASAAAIAWPPRSVAGNVARDPDSLPIGVRADEMITEPGISSLRVTCRAPEGTRANAVNYRPVTMTQIDAIRSAIVDGAPADDFASLELPESFRGAVVRAD